jgi:CheY-like chemotaxis protein
LDKKIRILIAEDDGDEREFVRQGFAQSNLFEVIDVVANGNELLQTIKSLSDTDLPDLILSDLNMPLLNGCEAMVAIKKDPRLTDIMFILISTSASPDTFDSCSTAGAFSILIKPASFFEYKEFAISLYQGVNSTLSLKNQ